MTLINLADMKRTHDMKKAPLPTKSLREIRQQYPYITKFCDKILLKQHAKT